jgi:ABC-type lipoprotein release transport system permease subunit
VLASTLFEISPSDPLTLAAVTGVLVTTALAAAFFPARRAARTDPRTALQC